jgi:hypothetical protein
MSRTGASGGWMLSTTQSGATGDLAKWAFHCWVKSTSAPGTSTFTFPVNIANGGTFVTDAGFAWDHTSAGFKQAVFNRRSSGAYDAAQLTSTLSANTWYAIGGSFDGTNLNAYLNGSKQASVASAAPSSSVTSFVSLLAKVNGANQFANGTIGEFASWYTTVPTDADFAALAKGQTAELILPQNCFCYNPLWGFHSPELDFGTAVSHRTMTLHGTLPRADEPPITPQLMPWE